MQGAERVVLAPAGRRVREIVREHDEVGDVTVPKAEGRHGAQQRCGAQWRGAVPATPAAVRVFGGARKSGPLT